MAERKAVLTDVDDGRVVAWSGLLNGDTGDAQPTRIFGDISFQVTGTFGSGGSVSLLGSNDGTNFVAITDPQGNAITKTSAAIEQVLERTRYVKPHVTAGDGTTSLVVTLWMSRIY